MKVREILHGEPPTAAPDESASSAWERMHEAHVNHLVVLEEGRVVGLVSKEDLSGPAGGAHRRMGRRVADLMRRGVPTVSPETDLRRAVTRMRRNAVACLPVVERGRLVGAVTVSDLLTLLERQLDA
jgi:acetoin utilization protein AcuB